MSNEAARRICSRPVTFTALGGRLAPVTAQPRPESSVFGTAVNFDNLTNYFVVVMTVWKT